MPIHSPIVHGIDLDPQTRCTHYNSTLDIVAIKMKCCNTYYACKDCHEALAGHAIAVWSRDEWDQRGILCGACKKELTIDEYMQCAHRCPSCDEAFNPGCRTHHHFYFAAEESPLGTLK